MVYDSSRWRLEAPDESHPPVDNYEGAVYFRHMKNGVYMRMTLLAMVLRKLQNAFVHWIYNRIFLMKDVE
jgi:hypothetical protein